jgi:hypothetical protein
MKKLTTLFIGLAFTIGVLSSVSFAQQKDDTTKKESKKKKGKKKEDDTTKKGR